MEAERRQLTVLFTDMVGFTSFSENSERKPHLL
jgi:class 3 adenylate cyclase